LHPSTPTASPETLTFDTSESVTLSTVTEGATIYYTTDGSTPTSESAQYSTAIAITETTTIKAIAIKEGLTSGILSITYTKS